MKRLALLLVILMMIGCSTVPVERKFPDVPKELMESCPDLKQTQSTSKLSEVLTVVVENYGQYHECKLKANSWMDWYNTQKQIFNTVK
jgi:hypothetical protein